MNDIQAECVELNFSTCQGHVVELANLLVAYFQKKDYDVKKLKGSINYDFFNKMLTRGKEKGDMVQTAKALIEAIQPLPFYRVLNVNAISLNNAGAYISQELGYALAWGNEYMNQLTDAGIPAAVVAKKIKFNFGISSNYFLEIAKFRAARLLWANIVASYKPECLRDCDNKGANGECRCAAKMAVHAETSTFNLTLFDAHVNLLRTQTEAMSAALGGVDSMTVVPFDKTYSTPDEFSERLARNQQLLLKEESHFDKVIDRTNTNSLKYDFAVERGRPADVLPLWVADMDFPAPQPVLDALQKAVAHGIFGYSEVKTPYYQAVAGWFERHFGWRPEESWLIKTPGVVCALAMAVRAYTKPGDAVLIQSPVYYPFYSVVQDNDRKLVASELLYKDGRYSIDLADFEAKIREHRVKMAILCSPHNPIGRVWTLEELQAIGRICKQYGVFVASDEIHCDFAFAEHPHHVFLEACPELADQALVCTAPSKTFNIAGLQVSNIWIPSQANRKAFLKEMDRSGLSQLNALGLVACQAAYEGGEEWLTQCKAYLRTNLDFTRSFLAEHLPQIRLVEPEGTYFAWLDCSALGLSCEALNDLVVNKAKLWLDGGYIFGKGGAQFQRVVLACPRQTLEQALLRLEKAVNDL